MASQIKYFTADPHPNLEAAEPSATTALTLAYFTLGDPQRPAVMLPSCYGGKLASTTPFLHTASAEDQAAGVPAVLADYFVIVVGMLGGAESSSPSNAHPSQRGAAFPKVTYEDNVRLQHALCQALGVARLAGYIGFSMGAQQAYHMAALFPGFVERIVVLAGSARTSAHNWSFLEGPRAALVNSVDFHDGAYTAPAVRGTRAFARVYSTWALHREWFAGRCWEEVGFETLSDYLDAEWDGALGAWDAHDLLCMLQTWQRGDISLCGPAGKGDLPAALAAIQARVLLMPSRTDMYFPPEDSAEELKHLKHGQLRVIDSVWGHLAGGGGGPKADEEFIKAEVRRFLAE